MRQFENSLATTCPDTSGDEHQLTQINFENGSNGKMRIEWKTIHRLIAFSNHQILKLNNETIRHTGKSIR
jgi:hypothetical protein